MKESVIYTMEVLVCSGLLLLAYNILLERRVSFLVCRIHLLASTAAAMIIPLLDIPVWAAETGYVATATYAGDIAAEIPALCSRPATSFWRYTLRARLSRWP